jgi:thiol-disulfide isomerase/thioredoxin
MDSRDRKGSRTLRASLCVAVAVVCGVAIMSPGAAARPASANDFTYEDINPGSPTHGQRLALRDLYADRGVVLNFLASWCGYCWKELPELQKLQSSIPTPIIGIAADEHDGPEALLGLIKQAGLKIPILLVPTTDIKAMEKHYDHKILPATYVIDKQGWVRFVFEGLTPVDKLQEAFIEHPTD